jgi:glutaredoxin
MPTICPKCRLPRQPNETAPDWQCPACGVCYAKVAESGRTSDAPMAKHRAESRSTGTNIPWGKLVLAAAVGWGIWTGAQVAGTKHGGASSIAAGFGGDVSAAELSALAATVKSGDLVMYSTTECQYCTQAKGWLNQYGFAFTECNMSVSSQCEREFKSYGGNGTPYLVVRGRHMKDGFDSDEFLALLKQ